MQELEMLQPENFRDTFHACQVVKRCNDKRVMAEAVKWNAKGTRINSMSTGIIVTVHVVWQTGLLVRMGFL